jgi:hypothetical protein
LALTTTTTATEFENVRVQQFGRVKDFALAAASESSLCQSGTTTAKSCREFVLILTFDESKIVGLWITLKNGIDFSLLLLGIDSVNLGGV